MERRAFLSALAAGSATLTTLGGLSGCATPPGGATSTVALPSAGGTRRNDGGPVIDVHTHWHAPAFIALLEKEGNANGAKVSRNAKGQVVFNAPGLDTVFQEQYTDFNIRLAAMDAMGVNIHVLSLTAPMVYWAPPAFGLKLSQVYNDELERAYNQYPTRFLGLASLPMQAPDLALEELNRVAKFKSLRGVYLSTHVNGKNLDEKAFWPVYARCEELGFHVYLHPVDPVGAPRMRSYYLRNFLGNPYDTGIAAASLMFGGVMDAYPKMEVILPHAGGTFPLLIGRMDHGTTVRPETRHMKKAPSTYLRRFHYDTITHHKPLMMYLLQMVGADRVVLGSDHPADMSYERPVNFVEGLTEVSVQDRDLILGGNAQRLLRM